MAWDNFTQSWFGVIFNPVGYMAQHKSVEDASHDYARANPPGQGLDLDSVTEIRYKTYRQDWVQQCSGTLKAQDVGYSLANATRNCQARFDEDDTAAQVAQILTDRDIQEKADAQAKLAKAKKTILIIIAATVIAAVFIYLFLSK